MKRTTNSPNFIIEDNDFSSLSSDEEDKRSGHVFGHNRRKNHTAHVPRDVEKSSLPGACDKIPEDRSHAVSSQRPPRSYTSSLFHDKNDTLGQLISNESYPPTVIRVVWGEDTLPTKNTASIRAAASLLSHDKAPFSPRDSNNIFSDSRAHGIRPLANAHSHGLYSPGFYAQSRKTLGSVDNTSSETRLPETCLRDPVTKTHSSNFAQGWNGQHTPEAPRLRDPEKVSVAHQSNRRLGSRNPHAQEISEDCVFSVIRK